MVLSLQNRQYASRTPRPGPGLVSSMYMMERPASCSLADANWVENTVVDGVVQEQHLCRFDEHGNQRQQAVADQKINACGKYGENGGHKRR